MQFRDKGKKIILLLNSFYGFAHEAKLQSEFPSLSTVSVCNNKPKFVIVQFKVSPQDFFFITCLHIIKFDAWWFLGQNCIIYHKNLM